MNPMRYVQLAMQEGIAIADAPEPKSKEPRLCFEFSVQDPEATMWVYFSWVRIRTPKWLSRPLIARWEKKS